MGFIALVKWDECKNKFFGRLSNHLEVILICVAVLFCIPFFLKCYVCVLSLFLFYLCFWVYFYPLFIWLLSPRFLLITWVSVWSSSCLSVCDFLLTFLENILLVWMFVFVCNSVCVFTDFLICVCLSVCFSVCLSVFLSVCLSVCLSTLTIIKIF